MKMHAKEFQQAYARKRYNSYNRTWYESEQW